MSVAPSIPDKKCFAYCGDDHCTCEAHPKFPIFVSETVYTVDNQARLDLKSMEFPLYLRYCNIGTENLVQCNRITKVSADGSVSTVSMSWYSTNPQMVTYSVEKYLINGDQFESTIKPYRGSDPTRSVVRYDLYEALKALVIISARDA
jgi:hypothetical protein